MRVLAGPIQSTTWKLCILSLWGGLSCDSVPSPVKEDFYRLWPKSFPVLHVHTIKGDFLSSRVLTSALLMNTQCQGAFKWVQTALVSETPVGSVLSCCCCQPLANSPTVLTEIHLPVFMVDLPSSFPRSAFNHSWEEPALLWISGWLLPSILSFLVGSRKVITLIITS